MDQPFVRDTLQFVDEDAADGSAAAVVPRPAIPAAWWQSWPFAALCVVLAAVPCLWPWLPPLVDLPGHLAGYRIMVEAGQPPLAHHFGFHWALIGNLGVELLVYALHPLLDVEPAIHLIVAAIPTITVAAMLWLAREVHGRLPATAAFAFPFAYAFPFQFGFVNFALAIAVMFAALALWIRLSRQGRPWLRLAVGVPLAGVIWLCHSFGWAMFGLFVFGVDWVLERERGRSIWQAALAAAAHCLPMALPVLAMIAGHQDQLSGQAHDYSPLLKIYWIATMLRERVAVWDLVSVGVVLTVLYAAIRRHGLSLSPLLAVPALLGAAVFAIVPWALASAAYVDERIIPYTVALALLAVRTPSGPSRSAARWAAGASMFFVLRLLGTTAAFFSLAQGWQRELAVLPHIPEGAAVFTLARAPSIADWNDPRVAHIDGFAITRRRAFTNGQWTLAGQQLVRARHERAAPYTADPSHLVFPPENEEPFPGFDARIAAFDRATFGYVWTIGFPPGRAHAGDLVPVWSNGRSALYRVSRR